MSSTAGTESPGVTRAFTGIFAATMLNLIAVGALLPVLPLYVKGPLGEGDLAVGIVVGAYAVTGVIFRPVAGHLADSRGRRWVLVLGSAISAVAGALLFVPLGLAAVLASRLVLGVGEGSVFTAGSAWVADIAPAGNRARLIGIYGLAVWSGLSIGPAVGHALMTVGGVKLGGLLVLRTPIGSVAISAVPMRLQTCATSSGNSANTARSSRVFWAIDSSKSVPARRGGSTSRIWSQPMPKRRSARKRHCSALRVTRWRTPSKTTKSLPRPCILVKRSFMALISRADGRRPPGVGRSPPPLPDPSLIHI